MTPSEFKSWRKSLGLKQKDIADLLGLKKRVIQYYEKGRRDGKPVEIPRTVELASYAISVGIGGFDGKDTQPIAAPAPAAREMETIEN
jgi:transcriptional regulator with XRE-family HTH domain